MHSLTRLCWGGGDCVGRVGLEMGWIPSRMVWYGVAIAWRDRFHLHLHDDIIVDLAHARLLWDEILRTTLTGM